MNDNEVDSLHLQHNTKIFAFFVVKYHEILNNRGSINPYRGCPSINNIMSKGRHCASATPVILDP